MPPAGPIQIGRVVGTHGVKGAVKVESNTDFPSRFDPGQTVLIGGQPYTIVSNSWHKSQVRLNLKGLESIEAADPLKWQWVYAPAGSRPKLGPDDYMESDLVGCTVKQLGGDVVGRLTGLLSTPANDLIVVDGEILIPAVKSVILSIDLDSKEVVVDFPLGGEE